MKTLKSIFIISTVVVISLSCKKKESNWTLEISKVKHSYINSLNILLEKSNISIDLLNTKITYFHSSPAMFQLEYCRDNWKLAYNDFLQLGPYRYANTSLNIGFTEKNAALDYFPINCSFLDYTSTTPTSGIISDITNYPQINKSTIIYNNLLSENNATSGFHVVEFLLWGEDHSLSSPGARSNTDYLSTSDLNDRRRWFLYWCSDVLYNNIKTISLSETIENQIYKMDGHSFCTSMIESLTNYIDNDLVLNTINKPLLSQNHTDEISDFSDNSLSDIKSKINAIKKYLDGRSLYNEASNSYYLFDLMQDVSPETKKNIESSISLIESNLDEITIDFEVAITSSTYISKINTVISELNKISSELKSFSNLF